MSRAYDRDPYAILGIPPTATASQVKEAYHRLARQYHPDLNKDLSASERMKDINWAYELLSDPQERSLYDYWRSFGVRTEYYYPGANPPNHASTSPRPTPFSTGGQTQNPPPYNPYRGRTYTNVRAANGSSAVGCSSFGIVWIIIIIVTNLLRAIGPSMSQRPNYDYSPEYRATQTAQMAKFESAIETLHATEDLSTTGNGSTPLPSYRYLVTPSPVPTIREQAEPEQDDWRTRIVPGSWEYHYIDIYFPELTTPNGLSAEVTDVIYHQLDGYQIKTRSSGEYWLHISPYDNGVSPQHIPPGITATPTQ